MVYVTHDCNDWRTGNLGCFVVVFIVFFQIIHLFESDKFYFKSKLTYHQFYNLCI